MWLLILALNSHLEYSRTSLYHSLLRWDFKLTWQYFEKMTVIKRFYFIYYFIVTHILMAYASVTSHSAPEQPVRGPYGQIRRSYGIITNSGLSIPLLVRTAPLQVRKWKTLDIPVPGSYDACTCIARGPCGVLRIIQWNDKCTAVSNCMGPVVWCDHENSTSVKFLWVLHSALRARNRPGDKNHTGPVVGCDWGISARRM